MHLALAVESEAQLTEPSRTEADKPDVNPVIRAQNARPAIYGAHSQHTQSGFQKVTTVHALVSWKLLGKRLPEALIICRGLAAVNIWSSGQESDAPVRTALPDSRVRGTVPGV
jgi:hypothetical protein